MHGRKPPNPQNIKPNPRNRRKPPPPPRREGASTCPCMQALRSVRRRKFRLARRYTILAVNLLAARMQA